MGASRKVCRWEVILKVGAGFFLRLILLVLENHHFIGGSCGLSDSGLVEREFQPATLLQSTKLITSIEYTTSTIKSKITTPVIWKEERVMASPASDSPLQYLF